jgi:hypothetical protein
MRKGKALIQAERAKELGSRFSLNLPENRKTVTITHHDFGDKTDVFKFGKTRRITTYLVTNENMKPEKMGWSVFCKRISTYYPSVLSASQLD